MNFYELHLSAKNVLNPKRLSKTVEAGGVGAAILTDSGNVYVGVCIDTACSMGFCAEHAAAASIELYRNWNWRAKMFPYSETFLLALFHFGTTLMITVGENIISKVVAVNWEGKILPPCGRCREFLIQLADENKNAEVMVGDGSVVLLKDLLPFGWNV